MGWFAPASGSAAMDSLLFLMSQFLHVLASADVHTGATLRLMLLMPAW